MLRGINKQNIFFGEDDCVRMMYILHDAQYLVDQNGEVVSDNMCTIYAYCILDNHIHILLREGERKLSDIMRRIGDRYVVGYNRKYDRTGHLFQNRFQSEPVNDIEYFFTLIRYIHRNPVKAMEARSVESYPYSSWNEYVGDKSNVVRVLKPEAIRSVLARYPLEELKQWVNQDVDDNCLDMDSFEFTMSDKEAGETICELSGCKSVEEFRLLDPATQIHFLLEATEHHVSLRQGSRIGTLSYYMLQKAASKKRGDSPIKGSDPMIDKSKEILGVEVLPGVERLHERIRLMDDVGKKTKHYMHLIVDYLAANPESQCKSVAEHLELSAERTRINLLKLSNNDIVEITGSARNARYTLKTVEILQSRGQTP